jgi:ABC-type sugar transport system substrate-binding protein
VDSGFKRIIILALAVAMTASACSSSATTAPATAAPTPAAPATAAPATAAPATAAPATAAPATAAPATPAASAGTAQLAGCVVGHSSPDFQNPYYVSLHDSLAALLKAAGCEYIATDSQQKPDKQLSDIENMIQRGVKVILIDAVDNVAIVPAFKAANDAGIPVITLIREPKGNVDYASYIWFDSVKHGRLSCQYIVDQLGGKGNVVNLQGNMATQPGQERSKGCVEAFDAAAPGISVVSTQAANWDRVTAERVMTDILTAHPNIDGVFGANDEEALGVVKAFQQAGQDPSKKVIVGIDGTQVAYDAICQGTMSATVATVPAVEAELAMGVITQLMTGQTPPKKVEFIEDFVTKANVNEIAQKSNFTTFHCP